MNDRELAENVSAFRVGVKNPNDLDAKVYRAPKSVRWIEASDFVRDWRVAGALLEKSKAAEFTIWQQTYDDDAPAWVVETSDVRADGRNESLPRAIVEACVRFLSHTVPKS